jgi:hypothetical protein
MRKEGVEAAADSPEAAAQRVEDFPPAAGSAVAVSSSAVALRRAAAVSRSAKDSLGLRSLLLSRARVSPARIRPSARRA